MQFIPYQRLICATHFIIYILTLAPCRAEILSLQSAIEKLLLDEHPYQIIIFSSDFSTSKIVNKLSSDAPTYKIKFTNSSFENQLSPVIIKYIQVSLIIIWADDLKEINTHIKLIVQQMPIVQQPKFLVVSYNDSYDSTRDIKNILISAWSHKILDITIIIPSGKDNSSIIHFFNPFNLIIYKKKLDENTLIFPNKFRSLRDYPLNVTFCTDNLFEKVKKGNEWTEFVKIDYTVRYMLKASNFDLKPVDGDNLPVLPYPEEDASSWFRKKNSNVLGIMFTIKYLSNRTNISNLALIPSEEYCRGFVILISLQSKIIFPSAILVFFVVIPGIMLIFLYFFYKVFKEDEQILESIQLLLGQSLRYDFRKTSSKIILFTLLTIYTILYNDIYSIIMSINYHTSRLVIENLADLAKTELPIYTSECIRLVYSNNTDETFKAVDEKIKWMPDCIDELVATRNVICLVDRVNAEIAVEKYRNPDGSPSLHIAATFSCDDFFYIFEQASPYLKRFITVVRRVHASGIMRHALFIYFGNLGRIKEFEISKTENEDVLGQLKMILFVGYFASSAVFISELLFSKIKCCLI